MEYNYLVYILKIIYYFAFVILLYNYSIKIEKYKQNKKNFVLYVVFLCIMFGIFTIIAGKYPYVSDRKNFAFRFADDQYLEFTKRDSLGLYFITRILHIFTYEPKVLFFSIAVLYIALTIFAYSKNDDVKPYAILMLGLSQYFSFGVYMLKQCIAVAFIAIAYSYLKNNKKKMAILNTIFAILFHESAWIVIPVYFAMKKYKNKYLKILINLFLVLFILFFNNINQLIVEIIVKIIPSMQFQLNQYLSNNGSIITNNYFFTIFKGIPFYFTFIYAYVNRKKLYHSIKWFDQYLFVTLFTSITFLLSGYMYWAFRLSLYFYFPIFTFMGLIIKQIDDSKDKLLFFMLTMGISAILTIRLWFQYFFLYGGV